MHAAAMKTVRMNTENLMATRQTLPAMRVCRLCSKRHVGKWDGAGAGTVSMDDHPHATDNALDRAEQELLISTVSDEALEKAAGGTTWAQTYPQTCVATMCVRDSPFPEMLSGQITHAR
jgi:hypothetical protein